MKIFVFLLTFISLSGHAKTKCSFSEKGIHEYRLDQNCESNECWVGLVPNEDTISIFLDNNVFLNLNDDKDYIGFDSFYLPISNTNKILLVHTFDLNQSSKKNNELCIEYGNFKTVKFKTSLRWFLKTGSSLFSAYFLSITSIFLFLSFFITRNRSGIALLAYSIISTIYLISFSEIPRLFFDPVLMSGGIHFPLRLLQDLALIYLLNCFYGFDGNKKFMKLVFSIYGLVEFSYLLMLISGVRDYAYFERIIVYLAFLVAAPMTIGLVLAIKSKDQFERRVLIPFFSILFLCQLNDLFCFWKIWDGYFTVKLYIPVIVILMLFLYFRRLHSAVLSQILIEEKQQAISRFVHDLKSPVSAIKAVALESLQKSPERSHLVKSALHRIEEMANELVVNESSGTSFKSIPIVSLLEVVIKELQSNHQNLKISHNFTNEVFAYSDDVKLTRILSNLVNNAAQSSSDESIVKLEIFESFDYIKISISDRGTGMSKDVIQKAIKGGFTTKEEGKGIGLSSANEVIKSLGGVLRVYSTPKKGTSVELEIPRGDVPFWYHTGNLNENTVRIPEEEFLNDYLRETNLATGLIYIGKYIYEKDFFDFLEDRNMTIMRESEIEKHNSIDTNTEIILVDDDKYVCKAWELNMKDKGIKIKTFQKFEDFILKNQNLPRSAKLYLDRHVGDHDLLFKVDDIIRLGFTNITFISSDMPKKGNGSYKVQNSKLPPN